MTNGLRKRSERLIGIPHWAGLIGLADDDRSRAVARALIAQGDGPQTKQRKRKKSGVRLRDHQDWLRQNEWAKFLAQEAARNRRK
ncbi:MAG: hypothetical protein ACLPXW_21315 [Xanthobacteraceae bacterium]